MVEPRIRRYIFWAPLLAFLRRPNLSLPFPPPSRCCGWGGWFSCAPSGVGSSLPTVHRGTGTYRQRTRRRRAGIAEPLRASIVEFYQTSFVGDWGLDQIGTLKAQKSYVDTLATLERSLGRGFEQFKQQRLKRWDRKEAQALIGDQVIQSLLETLRRSVTTGRKEEIEKIIPKLIQEKDRHD